MGSAKSEGSSLEIEQAGTTRSEKINYTVKKKQKGQWEAEKGARQWTMNKRSERKTRGYRL